MLYRDPSVSAAADPGLIAALMRVPTTTSVSPEENQFAEALAWTLRRNLALAREFALLFVEGDDQAATAVVDASAIGVETRVTGKAPGGRTLFPDISLCGPDRSFQLLVEIKVGSDFHHYHHPTLGRVSQPVMYAEMLAMEPEMVGARVRRVGTLSKDPAQAPQDAHPLRCADVSWERVRQMLGRHVDDPATGPVALDLIGAILSRITPPPLTPEAVAPLMNWAEQLLPEVARQLAHAIGGSTTAQLNRGTAHPYRGVYVDYVTPTAVPLRAWVYVTPEGGGYSIPGDPHTVAMQPDQGSVAKRNPDLAGQLAQAFRWERDPAGWDAWRLTIPADEVPAAGSLPQQQISVAARLADALRAAELVQGKD